MLRYLVPLIVFVVLVVLLSFGLGLDPREVPSPLINKPAPTFSLPRLYKPEEVIATADYKGKVWLLNVWASWCSACRIEHPLLNDLSRKQIIPIVGLNYKDTRIDAMRWLQNRGNPYETIAFDLDGRVGIDWGVYGVPETFVIDKNGNIRHKHTGPITAKSWQEEIQPLVMKLNQEPMS